MRFQGSAAVYNLAEYDFNQDIICRSTHVVYNSSPLPIWQSTVVEYDPNSPRFNAVRAARDFSTGVMGVLTDTLDPGKFGTITTDGIYRDNPLAAENLPGPQGSIILAPGFSPVIGTQMCVRYIVSGGIEFGVLSLAQPGQPVHAVCIQTDPFVLMKFSVFPFARGT